MALLILMILMILMMLTVQLLNLNTGFSSIRNIAGI